MNYCDWTERANQNGSVTWKCSNKTEEKQDEHGRAYCTEHRSKVDEINKLKHKNCINKEKIIKELKKVYIKTANQYLHLDCQSLVDLIINLESGKFD